MVDLRDFGGASSKKGKKKGKGKPCRAVALVLIACACLGGCFGGIDLQEAALFQQEIHPAVQSIPAVAQHVKRLAAAGWSRTKIEATLGYAAVQEAFVMFPQLFAGLPERE